MDKEKNLGILVAPPRPNDWILGANSKIEIGRIVKDWSPFLPAVESQRNKVTDFLDCVTMSGADHSIATQLNYLLSTNQLSDEAINFFRSNNYIVNGLFSLSSRFNAKLNNTAGQMGNYLNTVADCVRRDGILPESDWPTTENMTWDEFYKTIPQALVEKAKKAKWFLEIQYQWVNKVDFSETLESAPIQIATTTCPGWDIAPVVQKCPTTFLNHATMIYGYDFQGDWLDLDHYSPFKQILASDYDFPLNLQYVITMKVITLRNGMRGSNVLEMQKNLAKLGFAIKADGIFGPNTELIVRSFQNKTGLKADGVAGPLTLAKLHDFVTPKTLLDAIIQVESGGDDFAEGDKNLVNHAYGCLQIRQGVCDDVNSFYGTSFIAQDCIGKRSVSIDIWNKYWKVYPLIVSPEDRARTWNGGPRWKKIYFKPNKTPLELAYCKNLDIYWNKVKIQL